jgi:hypothetical protein
VLETLLEDEELEESIDEFDMLSGMNVQKDLQKWNKIKYLFPVKKRSEGKIHQNTQKQHKNQRGTPKIPNGKLTNLSGTWNHNP